MAGRERLLIIGLDGAPYSLIRDLAERGIMPNMAGLIEEGVLTKMAPTIPDVSAVSWSTIITGVNPGEHGVYGFTNLLEGTYILTFHDFTKLKAPTFWQMDRSKRYVVINVPSTYPASEINGFIVTGFVSPDLKKAVYPPGYLSLLQEIGYRVDIDVARCRQSPMLLFSELSETLDTRLKLCLRLWSELDWDVTMFVITGTDRVGHFQWKAYLDEDDKWHEAFLEFFSHVDRVIGELVSRLGRNDGLIMLSDHGMELLEVEVNLNAYLVSEGYLRLHEGRRGYNAIAEGTLAFALEPSRIYLNREGKYPRGCVKRGEEEELLEELTNLFSKLEFEGRKVVKKVYRRDEIYHGQHLEDAPDLVLVPERGFSFTTRISKTEVFGRSDLTGKHNDEAFLYVRGEEAQEVVPENPSVEDVLRIMRTLQHH